MSPPKITVGNVEITSVIDVPFQAPFQIFYPDRTAEEFAPYKEMYPASSSGDIFKTQASVFALRSSGQTVLCDTGFGPGPIEMLGGIQGRLLDALNEAGVAPDSVNVVVHTHMHADHVGWNLTTNGEPNFPNARYFAPQADWDYFEPIADQNPQMKQIIPLKESGRLELFTGEKELTPELTMIPTPGHTPGHSSLIVSSAGEKAFVMGDMAHHPAQVEEVAWCASFDVDKTTVVNSRRKIFDQAEHDAAPVAFGHFPAPFGKLVRSNGKRIFQAL